MVAVQSLPSCFTAGLGTAHPGAFHSILMAVTRGGFTKTGPEPQNLKGWCHSFVLWLCKLSEGLTRSNQNFWTTSFDLSTYIYLFVDTQIHCPSWKISQTDEIPGADQNHI